MLVTAHVSTAGAIRQATSNANPVVADLRQHVVKMERGWLGLPDGEERDALLLKIKELAGEVEAACQRAALPPTTTRAGKQQRRQQGRPEGQHKTTALHPGRTHNRKRALAHQQAGDYGDEFQPQAKKGKPSTKVRSRGRRGAGEGQARVCRHAVSHQSYSCNPAVPRHDHQGQRGRHLHPQRHITPSLLDAAAAAEAAGRGSSGGSGGDDGGSIDIGWSRASSITFETVFEFCTMGQQEA